jgi:hypothetical protein
MSQRNMNNMKLILIIMLLAVIFCSEIVQQCQPIVENKHTTKELVNFDSTDTININLKSKK